MVEELKLAIKVDDDSIEQSLLKQFTNAQKMADKVVLDFKNVNFDDKEIEAKFKALQKKAGQNPIDLSISKDSIQMLSQISDKLGDIFKIAQGKSIIDSFSTNADISKIENKLNELTKKYEDLQKKASGGISGKEFNLVDNDEFKKLQNEVKKVKQEIDVIHGSISQIISDNLSVEHFTDTLNDKIRGVSNTIDVLISKIEFLFSLSLSDLQKNLIPLYKDINQVFKDKNGKQISGYWDSLKKNIEGSNTELKELLKTLGLIDSKTNQLKLINDGMENSGGIIGEDKVLIARKNNRNQFDEKNTLKLKLQEAYNAGINVARILDIIGTKESNVFFDIQEKADGNILGNIYGQNEKDIVNTDWLYATDEQVQKLISDMIELQKMGINVESNLTNIMYDKNKGFSFIDMDLNPTNFENNAELIKDHMIRIFGDLEDFYADKNDKINQKLVKNARQRFENISKQVQQVYSDSNKTSIPLGDSITTSTIDTQNKLQEELKETQSQAKKAKQAVKEVSSTASQDQIKDTFSDSPTNTKPETEGMEQVEKATEEAVREKKDFATANEGVQSSIDGSENPLKLEAELMEQIAKSAREAADAKKEFVEANKQVKDSADESNSDLKAKPKKDRYAKRRKVSEEDFLNYSPNRVNKKLSNSGYTILGETVNTELVDGLVKVSAKIKDVDGVWKSFSAKVDADGNIFEQRFKTVTNGVDKLETALKNFGHETSPALTYQETLDKAQKIKNSLNLGDEYSIKVDSSEFVTITKKLTDVENAGSSVTQTFKSAQDAIDNFGKATSNSAEKTSVALKSIKSNVKEVVDETEKLANAQKEQNTNVNFNGYDKRLDSYNGKVDKYQATIDRFNDGGWTSDTYLKNVQAVRDAVKQYATLLGNIKTNQNGIASDKDIQNLDKYEKKIKDTIATVINMSASEKGYSQLAGQKEIDKINKILRENSAMSSEAKAKIKAYKQELISGNPSVSLEKIHGEIMKIVNAEELAGRAGRSFFDTLKNSGFHQIAAQMAGMFGVYDVINIGRNAFNIVKELDYALVDLKKTTAMNESQLESYYYDSNTVAKQMGVTTKEIIDQSSAWSRLGYNTAEASKTMAQLSSQFASISPGMDTTTSQEGLVSIMKAWNIGYQDVKSEIMDNINALGNSMAEDNQDVVEGMERSAAALAAVGTSYQDAFAMFSGIQEVLQNAEVSGRALRSIAMRIRGYDESTEELSEDLKNVTGELTDLTKTAEHTQGVSIFKEGSTTEFKSLVDYFGEIYDIWDEMSQKQQNDFLQKAFGKTQAQAGAALIQNYSAVTKSLDVMDNAAGSSDREMETVKQSITYKLNELKETWVGTVQDIANRKDLSLIISGLIGISKGLGFVIGKLGLIPTVIAPVVAILGKGKSSQRFCPVW